MSRLARGNYRKFRLSRIALRELAVRSPDGQVKLVREIIANVYERSLADLLTRIRNGHQAKKSLVTAPASNIRENVLGVLEREGYIRGFERYNVRTGIDEIKIELKYYDGEPVIREINRCPVRGVGSIQITTCPKFTMV